MLKRAPFWGFDRSGSGHHVKSCGSCEPHVLRLETHTYENHMKTTCFLELPRDVICEIASSNLYRPDLVLEDTINRHKTRENAREELAEFKARLNRAKEDAGMEGSMSPIYFLEERGSHMIRHDRNPEKLELGS